MAWIADEAIVDGCRSTGEVVGAAPSFVVSMGESALLDGANGRFFRMEALFVLTKKRKKDDA